MKDLTLNSFVKSTITISALISNKKLFKCRKFHSWQSSSLQVGPCSPWYIPDFWQDSACRPSSQIQVLWSKLIYTLSSNPHIQDFLVAVTEKQTFWVNLCFEMSIYFFADSKHTLNNLSTIYSQIGIMFWFICYQWPNQVLLKAAYRGNFFQT